MGRLFPIFIYVNILILLPARTHGSTPLQLTSGSAGSAPCFASGVAYAASSLDFFIKEAGCIDEHIDHPHRVGVRDVVIQALGQQRALASMYSLDKALHGPPLLSLNPSNHSKVDANVFTQPGPIADDWLAGMHRYVPRPWGNSSGFEKACLRWSYTNRTRFDTGPCCGRYMNRSHGAGARSAKTETSLPDRRWGSAR